MKASFFEGREGKETFSKYLPRLSKKQFNHRPAIDKLSVTKRALTLKQYRLLLYHQAIKQYITYGISHCSSMRGPVQMNLFCS